MWVKIEEGYYNTDHILSIERKEDAGVYYMIRFADGKETGFNEDQVKGLVEALDKSIGQGTNAKDGFASPSAETNRP